MAPTLLVRRPPTSLASGIVSHIKDERDSIDYKRALSQWQAYTQAYRQRGWQISEVEQDDRLADSVFVEDGVVFVASVEPSSSDGIFILASPGSVTREGEVAGIERALKERSSSQPVVRIEKPATLDGGDVLKVPSQRTIYVGHSQRTNEEGIRQFSKLVSPLGWEVKSVPVKKALHLKSMLTALPDGTIIGFESLVEDTRLFPAFVAMPEAEGVAVVFLEQEPVAANTLLISSSAPRSAAILRERGYEVVPVDVSEFEKLEGCVTCLSVRVRS